MDKDVSCSPQFRSTVGLPASQLNVGVISTGNGWITSSDGWISCGYDTFHVVHVDCTFNYSSGTQVVLSAAPSDSLNPYKADLERRLHRELQHRLGDHERSQELPGVVRAAVRR